MITKLTESNRKGSDMMDDGVNDDSNKRILQDGLYYISTHVYQGYKMRVKIMLQFWVTYLGIYLLYRTVL